MTTNEIKIKIESAKKNIEKAEKSKANAEKAIAKMAGNPELDYEIKEKTKAMNGYADKAAKARATLAKLESKLEIETAKETAIKNEFPAVFTELKEELIKHWNEYDKAQREKFRNDTAGMTRKEIINKYGYGSSKYNPSDWAIESRNEESAEFLVKDMFFRVREITGSVKELSGVHVSGPALNGTVIGENGSAKIETIMAGGYNIQRLHVRVLVHKL